MTVAIILICCVVITVVYLQIVNSTYIRPDCHGEFKPKWYHFSITVHCCGERLAKCPHCNRKGFCKKK